MWINPYETVNLFTLTKEILKGKLYILYGKKVNTLLSQGACTIVTSFLVQYVLTYLIKTVSNSSHLHMGQSIQVGTK